MMTTSDKLTSTRVSSGNFVLQLYRVWIAQIFCLGLSSLSSFYILVILGIYLALGGLTRLFDIMQVGYSGRVEESWTNANHDQGSERGGFLRRS